MFETDEKKIVLFRTMVVSLSVGSTGGSTSLSRLEAYPPLILAIVSLVAFDVLTDNWQFWKKLFEEDNESYMHHHLIRSAVIGAVIVFTSLFTGMSFENMMIVFASAFTALTVAEILIALWQLWKTWRKKGKEIQATTSDNQT